MCFDKSLLAGVVHGVYEAVRVMHPDAADLGDLLLTVAKVKAIAKPPQGASYGGPKVAL
jgi:hypothetical protein